MNFNSVEFLFFLLPATLLAFYAVGPRWRIYVLLVASLIFYGWSGLLHLTFMLIGICWGFGTAFLVERYHDRKTLILSIALPLFILFIAKYLNFTLDTFSVGPDLRDRLLSVLSVSLPAGISFYTFELVSYAIDIKDRRIPRDRSLSRFALFIAFFPHLIAGPILRYHELRDQLIRVAKEPRLDADFRSGIKFIAVGLFCKIFLSDVPLSFHDLYKPQIDGSSIDAAYSILVYSFIIYYDFWSYSLIAIGLAKLFAINLPRNFREPYNSLSPKDFWRRWHVTLSYWLRDYVYLKLGGNHRYVRNIAIVFVACGIWHGAGWNFIVWGAYHALLVIGYNFVAPGWDRMPRVLQVAATFLLISLGWPLFYLSLADFQHLMTTLVSLKLESGVFATRHWAYLVVIAAWNFLAREDKWLWNSEPRAIVDSPVLHAVLVFLAVVFFSYGRTFIYFRF